MDPNVATSLNNILENIANLTISVQTIGKRITVLEENRENLVRAQVHRTSPLPIPLNQRKPPQGLNQGCHWDARPFRKPIDQDEHTPQNVKIEVPYFDGNLDPEEYLDWETKLGHFFKWHDMSEARKIRFAKMKLVSQAKTYMHNIELLKEHRRQKPISTWEEMKGLLREKYLPLSYKQRLINHYPIYQRPEPITPTLADTKPIIRPTLTHQPPIVKPPLKIDNKEKEILGEVPKASSFTIRCFKCQGFGHIDAQCPTKTLHIEEPEKEKSQPTITENEEEIYEADPKLIEEFEEHENTLSHVKNGIVQPIESKNCKQTTIVHTHIRPIFNAISTEAANRLSLTPMNHPYPKFSDASKVVQLYFDEVVRLPSLPKPIVSNLDVRLISHFWKNLWDLMGTKLNFSSSYNPQIDSQIEVVNRNSGNSLHYLKERNLKRWDLLLLQADFIYNSLDRSIGVSPSKILYDFQPKKSVLLSLYSLHARAYESVESFAYHIENLHNEISQKINISNQTYKILADSHRQFQKFDDGNYIMIMVRLEWFSSRTIKKLRAYGVGPFKIVKKIGSKAYVENLPPDYGFSSTFNTSDLIKYKEPIMIPGERFEPNPSIESEPQPECPPAKYTKKHDRIERILGEQVVSTWSSGYQRYLVRWKGRPKPEDTWINREELQRIDPDLSTIRVQQDFTRRSRVLPTPGELAWTPAHMPAHQMLRHYGSAD